MRNRFCLILTVLLALASCGRDPNVVKVRYLESGNRYFEKGKIREAMIMYRKAIQTDGRYADAYYRLAKAEIKQAPANALPTAAVGPLRRAEQLFPEGRPEKIECQVRLAEIYISYFELAKLDTALVDDVDKTIKTLLKDTESYDGHRLKGRFHLALAIDGLKRGAQSTIDREVPVALAELERANRIKPNQVDTVPYLCKALVSQNRHQDAEKLYRSLLSLHKNYLPGYQELYILLRLYLNRPDEAEELLKQEIRDNPKEHRLLINLAQHYYDLGKREQVVKMLEQLKQRAKEYPQAYENAGDFYFRLGDGAEAIRQYDEGIKSGVGDKARYQKRIIEVHMAQGRREEARKVNDQIREANPKDSDAMALHGMLLLEKGEIDSATSQLRAVIARAPDNFVAHYNLGRALLQKRDVENARVQFAEAIRLRPTYLPARLAVSQIELSRREYSKALKTTDETLQIAPSNIPARLIRTAANLGLGNNPLVRNELDIILKAAPNNKDALFQMGVLSAIEKDFKQAEDYYRRCYDLNTGNARGLMAQVELIMGQKQPERAIRILDEEIQKYPSRLEFRVAKANLLTRSDRYDDALAEYEWLLNRLDKNSPMAGDILLRLGETLRRKGDGDGAIAALQKAKVILPNNSLVLNTLALLLDGAGRKEEARLAYLDTLRVEPENGVVLNNLAFLIANSPSGDLDMALTYAQKAKQKLPQVPEVADTLGLIYLKKNLPDDAIEIFKQCVGKVPTFSTYRYHLGLALHKKGDMVRAKEEFKAALANKPNRDEEKDIKQLLARIG
ncbi:MAG: tetratricopeptide repeat protein [Bryobacteraceae bacterium]